MQSIRLEVRGLGHVPAMKNNKMMARGKLITNPKRQQWMQRCIRSFVSQLNWVTLTIGDGTWTEQQQRSAIALSLPLDDSWQWIKELNIKAIRVPFKGMEGANILIERIP